MRYVADTLAFLLTALAVITSSAIALAGPGAVEIPMPVADPTVADLGRHAESPELGARDAGEFRFLERVTPTTPEGPGARSIADASDEGGASTEGDVATHDSVAAGVAQSNTPIAPAASVDVAFDAGKRALKRCNRSTRYHYGPQRGRVELAIEVSDDGWVRSVRALDADGASRLAECYADVIAGWRFPVRTRDYTLTRLWIF